MDYSPRNLALSRPAGKSIFEFLIEGRDELGVFASIVRLFADYNIDIRSITAESNPDTKENLFLVIVFCDFSRANCTVELFEKELRGLHFVRKVMSADMKGKLFDQFVFPTRIMNDKRVIVFRVGPLLKHREKSGQTFWFRRRSNHVRGGKILC